MAVIKNHKNGMWEARTYYKDLTGARKQKTKRGYKMSRPNVQKILYKNVQLVCLS